MRNFGTQLLTRAGVSARVVGSDKVELGIATCGLAIAACAGGLAGVNKSRFALEGAGASALCTSTVKR